MIRPVKPIGPPPFIDPIEGEWCRAFNAEENRALDDNKAKLEFSVSAIRNVPRRRLIVCTMNYSEKYDPDYKRPPSASDIDSIFEAAQRIIKSWNW